MQLQQSIQKPWSSIIYLEMQQSQRALFEKKITTKLAVHLMQTHLLDVIRMYIHILHTELSRTRDHFITVKLSLISVIVNQHHILLYSDGNLHYITEYPCLL